MISNTLRIGILIVALIIFISVIRLIIKNKMPVRYSLIWILSSLFLSFIAIFPKVFSKLANLVGFSVMSNLVIGIFIFILLMITMFLTVIVSNQRKKINLLIQELSITKRKIKWFSVKKELYKWK